MLRFDAGLTLIYLYHIVYANAQLVYILHITRTIHAPEFESLELCDIHIIFVCVMLSIFSLGTLA